jgi:hypothetical protein
MGDDETFSSSEATPYDPVINTANDILYFSGTPGIGICIDTALTPATMVSLKK